MKIKHLILAAVAAIATFAACQEKPEDLGEPNIDLSTASLNFDQSAGSQTITLNSTRAWKTADVADWIVVEPDHGDASKQDQTIQITVLENTAGNRNCSIKFTCGIDSEYLAVAQTGPGGGPVEGQGTKDSPYTSSQANRLGSELADGEEMANVFVSGKVSTIKSIDTSFGNAEYYISDDGSATDEFYIYRGYSLGGNKFKSEDEIKVGDEVVVYGTIVNFKGNTVEMTTGSKIVKLNGEEMEGGGDDGGNVDPITGTNLLTNGSFEDWTGDKPAAWDFTNGNATLTKVGDAKDGSNACEVAGAADANKRLMSKSYTLKAGTYQIQAYIKGEGQYRMGYAKLTNGKIADTQNDYIYIDENPVQATSDWTLHTIQFTLSDQTSISINFMNNKKGAGKSFIVDDVKLVTSDGGLVEGGDTPATIVDATVSQVLSEQKTDVIYRLTGTVSGFNAQYCSFDITDATGSIYVYSVTSETKSEYSGKLANGDTVTIEGTYSYYASKEQHEIVDAKITAWTKGGDDGGQGGGDDTGVVETTVAQLLADPKTDVTYRLSGTVSGFNSKYCSFDITDASGSIYVYSVTSETKAEYSGKLANGDTVTIEGKYSYYEAKSQHEIIEATITAWTRGGDDGGQGGGSDDYQNAPAATVAEFLAAKDADSYYKLSGKVDNFGAATCRFDLVDATGTVYVYSVKNADEWSSKIHKGGTITLAGKYQYYEAGNQEEVVDAYILSYDASTETGDVALSHPLTSGITWTLGANAYDNTSNGTSKQSAVVNGQQVDNLLKLSSSKNPGTATLTIPAGCTKIGFYACGWSAADITVGSEKVSVKKNAGCTGNPAYTLELSDDADYYEVAVSGSSVEVSCPTRVLLIGINAVN